MSLHYLCDTCVNSRGTVYLQNVPDHRVVRCSSGKTLELMFKKITLGMKAPEEICKHFKERKES